MKKDLYKLIINQLQKEGYNFRKGVHLYSFSDLAYFAEWAKAANYRRPRTAYHSTGACFYLMLQRIYIKMQSPICNKF